MRHEPQAGRSPHLRPRLQHGCSHRSAKDKTYPAEIVAVISNRSDAGGLTLARANGVATEVVDHAAFGKDRAAFERALQAALEKHRIDIVCLAGFMRLLTAGFVKQWQHRILNIHPALLPAFKGLDTHRRVLEAGVKVHGATVHFVVPEMDSGPIIAQAAVNVRPGKLKKSSRHASSRSSTKSIHWLSNYWPKDAFGLKRGDVS